MRGAHVTNLSHSAPSIPKNRSHHQTLGSKTLAYVSLIVLELSQSAIIAPETGCSVGQLNSSDNDSTGVDRKMWKSIGSDQSKPEKQRCNRCGISGRIPCDTCNGKGEMIIGRDERGYPKFACCSACFGLKTMRCRNCGGAGFI